MFLRNYMDRKVETIKKEHKKDLKFKNVSINLLKYLHRTILLGYSYMCGGRFMRMQKVLELTDLSKKAVYFYIKEELINPTKNLENGYYDFSNEDIKKLQVITSLRKIGMPIQDIKELFLFPALANFFIHRQINNLKESMGEQVNQLETAYYLIEKIPTNATANNLAFSLDGLYKKEYKSEAALDNYFPNIDSRMIAILIWAAFTDIEVSEYHNFLWEKISNELNFQMKNELIYLKKLVYSLTPEQIYNSSAHIFKLSNEISGATEEELLFYENKLFDNCKEMLKDKKLQEYWKAAYELVLKPTSAFLNSKVDYLFKEYNPRYCKYSNNMNAITKAVFQRLKSEQGLLEELVQSLDNKFSPEEYNYGDLLWLYTFKGSIFTQLEIEDLKELLL